MKNFQLCSEINGDDVVLQFGRIGKHRFNMDVKFPLSPFQGFAICVACMDGKIADRQGYEFIKKLTGIGAGGGSSKADEKPAVPNAVKLS